MNLPSFEEVHALHKKYAPTTAALDSVWKHCQVVRMIALQFAEGSSSIDRDLVEVGALLHDIGVYKLYNNGLRDDANYVTHGLLGYELLQSEGFDEAICRFALLHTGVGITKQDVVTQNLSLPPRDYIAETAEEKIVMYADKFHTKSEPPVFNTVATYSEFLRSKFGEEKATKFRALVDEFGEPDLEALSDRYGYEVV